MSFFEISVAGDARGWVLADTAARAVRLWRAAGLPAEAVQIVPDAELVARAIARDYREGILLVAVHAEHAA